MIVRHFDFTQVVTIIVYALFVKKPAYSKNVLTEIDHIKTSA